VHRPRGWQERDGAAFAVETEVLMPCAAVGLYRRAMLQDVGLFDEDYFFTFEDLDLCLRARRAGYRSVAVAGALAYHEGSASIGPRSPRRVYFAARNHLLLAKRATPSTNGAHRLFRAGCIVAFNLAHVIVVRPAPLWPGLQALARAILDHARSRYGAGADDEDEAPARSA